MAARSKGWVCGCSLSGDCGFEFRLGHGRLFLASVVCCQVEVSATDRSLFQRSSTESGVSECDLEK